MRLGQQIGRLHAVRRAIADTYALPKAEAVKAEEERLDYLTRVLNRVIAERGGAVDVVNASLALLKVAESRRRLLGLDQPHRRVVDVITESAVDSEIKRLEDKLAARADGLDPGAVTAMALCSDLMDARAALTARPRRSLCAVVKAQAKTNRMLVELATALAGEDRGA